MHARSRLRAGTDVRARCPLGGPHADIRQRRLVAGVHRAHMPLVPHAVADMQL